MVAIERVNGDYFTYYIKDIEKRTLSSAMVIKWEKKRANIPIVQCYIDYNLMVHMRIDQMLKKE